MESSAAYQMGQVLGMMMSCVLMLLIPGAFLFTLAMALTRKTRGWIIGAVVSGLVGLLLIGGALASGVYLATKAKKEVQVFTSSDQLYSITGASGWRALDLEAPDATLQIGNLFAEEYLMVIPEEKSELSGIAGAEGVDLIEFAEIASAQTGVVVEDAVTSALVEVEIGGRRGYQQEMSGSIEGNEISYLLSYVEGKDHFYQIIAWTLTDRKEKTFPRLREAVATFSEAAVP